MSDLRHHPFAPLTLKRHVANAGSDLLVERIGKAADIYIESQRNADILVLETSDALTPFFPALVELAEHATDSNPLFEAPSLQAAMQHLQSGNDVRLALIWAAASTDGSRELIGAIPYQKKRFYLGLPIESWSVWTHIHSFLATPILRHGHEHEALRRFLRYADQSGAKLMRFPIHQSDGAFGPALTDVLVENSRRFAVTERHERAFLDCSMEGEAYLATHMRKKKRKEYNRLWNRLAETGALSFEASRGDKGLKNWLADFFLLESSGWKGKRGTALSERRNERVFFEMMCREAVRAEKFHAASIILDGKPIAMLASFVSGQGAYSFKIAYNEDYARFSPGALLMMKVIDAFHSDPRIKWVDSCAIPNHPMIDHIWAERRQMRELNAATAHWISPYLIIYSEHMSHIASSGWQFLRRAYHRFRKEVERG